MDSGQLDWINVHHTSHIYGGFKFVLMWLKPSRHHARCRILSQSNIAARSSAVE